jgi:PTH1 family peptidyl-tRNA hydrolase
LLPQTYMNLSGKSVGALTRFYKIQSAEVLVAHDELDFPPGVAKLKLGGGVAGHNGLTDIAERLGAKEFWRLRIGIGHPGDKNLVPGYVLSAPSPDDRALIDDAIARALEVSPLILAGDLQAATTKLHTRKPATPPDEPPGGGEP